MMRGHFSELIALLESGIGLERAHMGIFTALGEMYANHEPPKLMEHLKLFCTRVNIPRLISICDRQMLWRELNFLYEKVPRPPLAIAHAAASMPRDMIGDRCCPVSVLHACAPVDQSNSLSVFQNKRIPRHGKTCVVFCD